MNTISLTDGGQGSISLGGQGELLCTRVRIGMGMAAPSYKRLNYGEARQVPVTGLFANNTQPWLSPAQQGMVNSRTTGRFKNLFPAQS